MENNKPVEEIKLGSIKASIWENETKHGKRKSVTITKIYKSGDEWKTTQSFGKDDLLVLAKVADKAHTQLLQ